MWTIDDKLHGGFAGEPVSYQSAGSDFSTSFQAVCGNRVTSIPSLAFSYASLCSLAMLGETRADWQELKAPIMRHV